MPLPKRRFSKTRRDKRRTHWKLAATSVVECSDCNQPKLPHRACPNCGFYNNRMIFTPKES